MRTKLPATTPEEIYQHYLRGPAVVLRLFERVFGALALYEPPPPDLQQSTIEALGQEIDRLKAQIARLQEQISRLHHHNFGSL